MATLKTTETVNATKTPNTPDWMSGAWQDIFKNAGLLGAADPKSFIAGSSPLQTQAYDAASTLGYQPSSLIGDAASMAKSAGGSAPFTYQPAEMTSAQIGDPSHATAATAYGGISNYTNPFEDTVVKNTLDDLNTARQMTMEGNGQGAIGAGQYGSSRHGVLDRTANKDFIDRSGVALGNLRLQGFTTALGAADSDANRAQAASIFNAGADNTKSLTQAQLDQQAASENQGAKNTAWASNAKAGDTAAARALTAAGLIGDLGQTQGSEQRANIGLLGTLGDTQQKTAQAEAAAPLTLQQMLSQIYASAPESAFVGETTNGTTTGTTKKKSSIFDYLMNNIASAGQAIASGAGA